MSATGTFASIAGGLIIGATMSLCLIAENVQCRESWLGVCVSMVGCGAVAGGVGSLVSLVQQSEPAALVTPFTDRFVLGSHNSTDAVQRGEEQDIAGRECVQGSNQGH